VPEDKFSDEFYERWDHLISDVEITDVPMRFIKEVNILFNDGNTVVFDVQQMLLNDNPALIEECIEVFLDEQAGDIMTVDFHINVGALASEVETKTNRLLDND
jgi:hypothetical protein